MAWLKPGWRQHTRKGFSLVELAMVLVAAGLVVGMGSQVLNTKTVTNTNNEASINRCYAQTRAAMNSMNATLQQFFVHHGYYPLPAPTDNSSGAQVAYGSYSKILLDNTASPKVAIGNFPYATLGLPKSFSTDCFNNAGVVVTGHTAGDSYYRYAVSLDSVGDTTLKDANYKAYTTHGALVINTSATASVSSKAVFAILSQGSKGCTNATTTGKAMNCASSFSTTAPFKGFANFAFTRIPTDPKFFDDVVVFYGSRDNACGAGTVFWTDPATGIQCSDTVSNIMKPGVITSVSSTAPYTTGTASLTCKSTGSGYTLSAIGNCVCSGAVANGHIVAAGSPPVCNIGCNTGYAAVNGQCLPITNGVCSATPGTCSPDSNGRTGTPLNDNGTTCGPNRTWTCQGQNSGSDASCSSVNPPCYTGTWTAGSCSSACGQSASSVSAVCTGGNGLCDPALKPGNTSCAATASCNTGTWTKGSCSCSTSTYGASSCTGGNGLCSGSDPYLGTSCTPTGCSNPCPSGTLNSTESNGCYYCLSGADNSNGGSGCGLGKSAKEVDVYTDAGTYVGFAYVCTGQPITSAMACPAANSYTGTWTAGSCPTACGTAASTVQPTCSNSNCDPSTQTNYVTSCAATAACSSCPAYLCETYSCSAYPPYGCNTGSGEFGSTYDQTSGGGCNAGTTHTSGTCCGANTSCLSAPGGRCNPSSVTNGTVNTTTCAITCNTGYKLSGTSCVALISGSSCVDECNEVEASGKTWCKYNSGHIVPTLQCVNGVVTTIGTTSGLGCDTESHINVHCP